MYKRQLETQATKEAKEKGDKAEKVEEPPVKQLTIWRETKKPRARVLQGETTRINTCLLYTSNAHSLTI